LAKLHSHHYPGLLDIYGAEADLQNNSEIILKRI